VGLQLYTVREDAARDLQGTLARTGELGFDGVELFSLGDATAADARSWADGAGLAVVGWHAQLPTIEDELDELVELLGVLGTTRLTIAWIEAPQTAAEADVVAGRILTAAERAAARGLSLGFHNHAGELTVLDDGRSFLDRLLESPAELLALELDLGWVWDAGVDPVGLLGRAAGRCPLVHVKDFAERGTRAFRPVGDGAVDYRSVLPAALAAGVEWLLVEQDETDGPAFAAVERSLAEVGRILAARA
jgi:sugar phosphate isomerase/epimerase